MDKIRFDDVAALESRVSEEFGPFGAPIEVTQDMIDRFADLTLDHQWIHQDTERTRRESPFGGPIAHGFLTLSLVSALAAGAQDARAFQIVGAKNVVNYGSDKLRFLSPVPAGSKIHARARLVSVQKGGKGTRVEREIAVHVVGSERPALLYSSIALYQG
jgi:acyl dehydratase